MFLPLVKEISLKTINICLSLVVIMFSRAKWCEQFGRGHHDEHFCEIILGLTASHTRVAPAKQASCLVHSLLSMLMLAVPLYTLTKPLMRLHIKYKTVLFPKI